MPTIIEMVTGTRLDCAVGSAGLMRLALANAIHHCRHRTVFQEAARRPAADAAGAGRPGARRGGGHRAVVPALPQLRPRLRPARGGLAAADDAGDQVLGVQDRSRARLRGDGVPRRQRLRRGGRLAARSTASCRSTPSGRARATSWRSTSCACCSASRKPLEIVMDDLAGAAAGDRAPQGAPGARAGAAARAAPARPARPRPGRGAWRRWPPAPILRAHAPASSRTPSSRTRLSGMRARPTARGSTGPIRARSSTARFPG